MLLCLSIRDVVLIDRLDIAFEPGLTVLTGETGAGKSILLDSLGLALGARSEGGLLRPGASQLSVAAEFAPPPGHPVWDMLAEHGFESDTALVVRRLIGSDGRSRAFVNDQPASIGLLKRLGGALVEIHGQFESHTLLDSSTHRTTLDAFGRLDLAAIRAAFETWRMATQARMTAEADLARAGQEEDILRHNLGELTALDCQPGEEAALADRRALMMAAEKLVEGMNAASEALSMHGDVEDALRAAQRVLERVAERAQGRLDDAIAALDRAALDAAEARTLLDKEAAALDLDPKALDAVEERLFALRATARKHNIAVDDLPILRERLTETLARLESGGADLARLAAAEAAARDSYIATAKHLGTARRKSAVALDRAIAAELPPLKLDKAKFRTRIEALAEADWNEFGSDRVAFEIATNPGAEPGPLSKIASGGELSRFMLALKVVLARTNPATTLVFDEVDSGIGGAVAAAVGDRLARLGSGSQVLVVTHSPQVAAKGAHHWRIVKGEDGKGGTLVRADLLKQSERREEIARMLAGASVTDQARAAADSLLEAAG
jgi:DNA repair protein RecN (Recombination protein N)